MKNHPITSVSKKPKVLIVGPSPSQIGGVATFLGILLSSQLLNEKFELIHIDTSRDSHGTGVAGRFTLINLIYFVRQIVEFVRISLRERPQITHLPINMSWAFWKESVFLFLAQILGMKVVAHLHEGVFDRYYLKSPLAVRWLIGWVLHRADVVIALSNSWKVFLLKEVRPDINVQVVPNTIDPAFASIVNNKISGREKTVLFVGGLSQKKGLFDILKAVPLVTAHDKDVQFLFAGSPETECDGDAINQICKAQKLEKTVKFLGVVTGQKKIDLFQRAMVFVLPSYVDNFPYSLLEAMSSGLPVVTTPVGAIPEVVEDGRNGFLIKAGDYKMLADRIIKLLHNSQLRQKIGMANTALIQNNYLPETAYHHFDQIYSTLITGEGEKQT
jgi:glycosyltransferase involved in cell wall biosynthesis